MSKVKVTWRGGSYGKVVAATAVDALEKAATMLAEHIKETISTPYPPASEVGEPPHRRSGRLHDAVRVVMIKGGFGAKVGIIEDILAPYAVELELGTKRMGPRPFVRPALDAMMKPMAGILGKKIRGAVSGVQVYHGIKRSGDFNR